nr:uncharacterized protein LOC111417950 [Onthophagus taurus]
MVVFGVLALISASIAIDLKSENDETSDFSASSRDITIGPTTMDDEMLSTAVSVVTSALVRYNTATERVLFIQSSMIAAYPDIFFNVVEDYGAYTIKSSQGAQITGPDLNGKDRRFLIFS